MTPAAPWPAMARIATNVAVLSAGSGPASFGITANLWGEAANPGYVLVTLRRDGRFLPLVMHERAFVANVLGAGQERVALRFAQHADGPGHRIEPGEAEPAASGPARMRVLHAWFSCAVTANMAFGSYEIVTAAIRDSGLGSQESPLLFHGDEFKRLAGS